MSDIIQSHLNKSRDDKFLLVVNLPQALKNINSKFTRNNKTISLDSLQFSVYGTILPDIVVPAVETRYGGSNIYISSHSRPAFPPITVNFTIDNQFNNYWCIYQWLNLLRDEKEGVYGIVNARQLLENEATLKDYSTVFNLFAIDEFNNPIIRFDYINAFPTKLGSISWTHQGGKEVETTFEFAFGNITATLL